MFTGLIFALTATFAWGFGDFFIQKSTRKIGNWKTLFMISLFGSILFLPFVFNKIPQLLSGGNLFILLLLSCSLLISTLLSFESFKQGKLAVTDPFYALEIPIAGLLAFFLIGESIKTYQTFLIIILIIGLLLISLKSIRISKKILLEEGVIFAVFGATLMGFSSYLIGYSSRITDPLLTTWFFSVVITVICLIYLVSKKELGSLLADLKYNKSSLLTVSLIDNLAWIAYAFALNLLPMAIVVALVESSIVINVLLGIFLNKEEIVLHQKVGLILAVVSAIVLVINMGV